MTATTDVLEVYGIEQQADPRESPGGIAAVVLDRLGDGPASIDELSRVAGQAPGEIAAALIELELAGRVSEGDGLYRATMTR